MTDNDQTKACACGPTCECPPVDAACACGTACTCGETCTCTAGVGAATCACAA